MIIFVAPNHKEHHRFNRFFIRDGDIKITYNSLRDVIKLSQLAYRDDVIFVFNGLRPPDIFALKFLQSCDANIILLQHNSQVVNYSFQQVVRKWLSDIKKYVPWSTICVYFVLLRLFFNRSSKYEKINVPNCFVYGDSYKNKINSLMPNASINFMPQPNMFQYGSIKDLKVVNKHINVLFIDEPFETTLGCSSAEIVSQIVADNDEELIHIKLHPRSDPEKYNIPTLNSVRYIDFIPSSIGALYGFKSNLFTFIECTSKRYFYDVELEKFKLAPVTEKEGFVAGSYIESVNYEINKLRES